VSDFSDAVRIAVTDRAGGRCEYCRLPAHGQVATFPIDHIIPRTQGGSSALDNLALACPHCNARKWAYLDGPDPVTGQPVSLFHPRTQTWADHFQWSATDWAVIDGTTPCGRATVARLQMNHPDLLAVRRLLVALGLFPEIRG
jgi:hypothetical protein